MLHDHGLVLREVDAEGLALGHVAVDPLDVRGELREGLVRLGGSAAQLLARQRADARNIPFDDESAEGHSLISMPLLRWRDARQSGIATPVSRRARPDA